MMERQSLGFDGIVRVKIERRYDEHLPLKDECSVPSPHKPKRDMNPKFLGSDTDVALQ